MQISTSRCDLRRPGLHTLFGLGNDTGVTTMVLEQDDAAPPLQATGVAGLSLLASGPLPPRPADILGSRRMERIIARLRDEGLLPADDAALEEVEMVKELFKLLKKKKSGAAI